MKNFSHFKNVALASLALAFMQLVISSPALAEHHEAEDFEDGGRWYVEGGLGTVPALDRDVQITGHPTGDVSQVVTLSARSLPSIRAAIGRHMGNNIRIEGEIFWIPYDIDGIEYLSASQLDAEQLAAMSATATSDGDILDVGTTTINVYLDLENKTALIPYIGVGAGFARVTSETASRGRISDTALALQFRTGVAYQMSDQVKAYAGYRLRYLGETSFTQDSATITGGAGHVSVYELGFRYTFSR